MNVENSKRFHICECRALLKSLESDMYCLLCGQYRELRNRSVQNSQLTSNHLTKPPGINFLWMSAVPSSATLTYAAVSLAPSLLCSSSHSYSMPPIDGQTRPIVRVRRLSPNPGLSVRSLQKSVVSVTPMLPSSSTCPQRRSLFSSSITVALYSTRSRPGLSYQSRRPSHEWYSARCQTS